MRVYFLRPARLRQSRISRGARRLRAEQLLAESQLLRSGRRELTNGVGQFVRSVETKLASEGGKRLIGEAVGGDGRVFGHPTG